MFSQFVFVLNIKIKQAFPLVVHMRFLFSLSLPFGPHEPILFPKLRIYFADFPYLLCSIDQRLQTLET